MLDPENLNEVIGTYHRSVADVVARFEGQIAKSLGHGVLAFFGYPQDHENEAERAVWLRSSWFRRCLRSGEWSAEPREIRVGIATGSRSWGNCR